MNTEERAKLLRERAKALGFQIVPLPKVPLGLAEAEIVFTGESLQPEDFDALRDYVDLFKKQYVRKVKASQPDYKGDWEKLKDTLDKADQ